LQEPGIQVETSQGNSTCPFDIHSDPSEQKSGANVPSIIMFTQPREIVEELGGKQKIILAPPHIPEEFQWLTEGKHIWALNGKSQHLPTVASHPVPNEANNEWVNKDAADDSSLETLDLEEMVNEDLHTFALPEGEN